MRVLRSERGGISAEYVALLAVVVAIIAAIPYADIGAAVEGETEGLICGIATDRDLEGGCGRDGGRSDSAGRDAGANSPPTGEPSRGLGPIIARRAAVPVAQTVTGPPASSRGGRGGATLLPMAAVRLPVRPAWIVPVLREVAKGIGKGVGRLFGKGRKPPAARPTPARLAIPKSVTDKIPRSWGSGRPAGKGGGTRWADPRNPKGEGLRIDPGNPASPFPSQRVDHVIVRSGGRVLGRDGKPIRGRGRIDEDPENAHIPLSQYRNWSRWNSP